LTIIKGHRIMPTDFFARLRSVLIEHSEDRACTSVDGDLAAQDENLFLANEIEPPHEDLQPALRDLRSR
jgi:hypothetical protein